MKIACVGAGPAGLYFSLLMKLRHPEHEIVVFERNPVGATLGWALVFWDDLLTQLYAHDPVSAERIDSAAFRWVDQVLDVAGWERLNTDSLGRGAGSGYTLGATGYSIGRQSLVNLLANRAIELGVKIEFDHEVSDRSELGNFDLIVASDGVNSRLRDADRFGSHIELGLDKYVWLGTSKVFESFYFAFVQTQHGWIWVGAYGIDENLSTFVVECPPATWKGLGFETMPEAESLAVLEQIFAASLDGHKLVSQARGLQTLPWQNFRHLKNEAWHDGNMVLVGDAAHTTHYSIGSGTKLAIEDAIALADSFDQNSVVDGAVDHYEKIRKAALQQPQADARYSALFMENIARYVRLPSHQFFALWQVRRSPLLARVPPRAYYWLHHTTSKVPLLAAIRNQLGLRMRAVQSARDFPGKRDDPPQSAGDAPGSSPRRRAPR